MLKFLRSLFAKKEQVNVQEMMKKGAILIDVRSPREFSQWHAKNAKNIPLNKLQENIDYFRKINKPILLCCASGVRSSQARFILKANNISEVYDAGTCRRFAN